MFLLKILTNKNKKNEKNETKKNRMKIKDICIPSNKVFQVPFKKEQIDRYKGSNDFDTNDCYYHFYLKFDIHYYYYREIKKLNQMNLSKQLNLNLK